MNVGARDPYDPFKSPTQLCSRSRSTLRLAISIAIAAASTALLCWLLPRRLAVVTDIVGYPIHANFNFRLYFWRYYLTILFAPAVAAAVYHLIGLRRPGWCWPDSTRAASPQPPSALPRRWLAVVEQGLRAFVVGATFALGWATLDARTAGRFWVDVLGGGVAYVTLLAGAVAFLARRQLTIDRVVKAAARTNALAASLTVVSLYAASRATRVIVQSDRSVHAYPWFPAWLTAAMGAGLLGLTLYRSHRARGLGGARRIEAQNIAFVAVPIVVWLYTAALPLPLGWLDSFHIGEFTAGAALFHGGAFPWRDFLFIHGLLQDVFTPLAGFRLFGNTIWGGWAGFSMLLIPAWWTATYLLFVYLLRRNVPLLVAASAAPLLGPFAEPHWRFAPLPLVLLALASVLERATWPRAFLLAFSLVASNVLVPELAYAVPACGAALVGFELAHRRDNRPILAELPRTIRVTVAGLVLVALWFAWLFDHHAASAFLDYYAAFAPGHALTGAIPHLREPRFLVLMFLPPALVLLAIWYAIAATRMRWRLETRDWVVVALVVFTALYYAKFLGRPDWHVLQAVSPALPLLYYGVDKVLQLSGLRTRRAMFVAAGSVFAASALSSRDNVVESLSHVPSSFVRSVRDEPPLEALGWTEPTMAAQAAAWTELRKFVDATLDPDDTLFDFTNQPAVYHYLLRRKPATRYYHVSMAILRAVQLDVVEELERSRPKLVVFDTDSGGLPEWDGVTNEVRHYEISRYLLRAYRPFARVRGQVFYIRTDLAGSPVLAAASAEVFRAPHAYLRARPCNWGYAPGFMPAERLGTGMAAEPGSGVLARRIALSGWAADARTLRPAPQIVVLAKATVVARVATGLRRPDVAHALGSPALEWSGFSTSQEWIDPAPFDLRDLRVYATSKDGKASPLETTWHWRGDGPSELKIDLAMALPVTRDAARGWVDRADVEESERIAPYELPAGTRLSDASGIEIDIDASRDALFVVSDRPFTPSATPDPPSQSAPADLLFRVAAPRSGTVRVLLDNCPQWHALPGNTLYLRHPDAVAVHALRILQRDEVPGARIDARSIPKRESASAPH